MAFAFHTQRKEDTGSSTYDKALLEEYKSTLRQQDSAQKTNQQAGVEADTLAAKTITEMLPHISRNPDMLRSITTHPDWATSTYPALRRQGLGSLFAQDPAGNWQVNYQKQDAKKSRTFDDFLIEQAEQMYPTPGPNDTFEQGVNPTAATAKILQRQADYVSNQKAKAGIIGAQGKSDIPTQASTESIYDDIAKADAAAATDVADSPDIRDFVSRLGKLKRTELKGGRSVRSQDGSEDISAIDLQSILDSLIADRTTVASNQRVGQMARNRQKASKIASGKSPY